MGRTWAGFAFGAELAVGSRSDAFMNRHHGRLTLREADTSDRLGSEHSPKSPYSPRPRPTPVARVRLARSQGRRGWIGFVGYRFWRFLTGTARNIPAARCGRAGEPRAGTPGIKCANWRIGLPARGGGLNRAAAIPRSALSRRHPRGRDFDAARDIHPPAAGPSWAPRPCGDPRAPIAATPPETQ